MIPKLLLKLLNKSNLIICHFIVTKVKRFPAAKLSRTLQILHCSGNLKLVQFKTKLEERRSVVI